MAESNGDDIVISGMSGRLPESDSIEEFAKKLFDGVDLVTADDRRWPQGLHGLPKRNGKLKNLTHFDSAFFGVHLEEANLMDPQLRMLLELTHEAIVDAGFNPQELRGSRTGVYVGVSSSETNEMRNSNKDLTHGSRLTGCYCAMFPNRVSYTFDFKGPSLAIDTVCSSSMYALAQATAAIRAGHCDAAIVAGTNICLMSNTSENPNQLNMLSPEGRCAAFDADGSGYVRSEAVVAVLLQRRRVCRRLYCTVRGARMNTDGYKSQGITNLSGSIQLQLAQEMIEEAHLRPQDIVYVEAHGTGIRVNDSEEINAIADLFCEGRTTPLLIGSVKSNMGHSEAASGLCSIVKVVVAMEREVIPANLHYRTPNPDIPALSNGSIKVVDRNTPWQGGLVAVNSFGFGGANAHVILESQGGSRPPPASYPAPRLVLASGRTEAAVARLLRLAAEHPRDAELHALLDAVHARAIPGHTHRGFALINTELKASPVLETSKMETTEKRPIWFVFDGMGSQWPKMGRALMRLPIFAASIARMAAALRPLDFDLTYLLTEAPEAALDNIINSATSISAVQVALVDVLREVGIQPDGIIGHSAGEMGCAYADDTLTAEQVVVSMYWRTRYLVEASLPPGAMAAVGLSWAETERRCPPDVIPACHNAADSVTVAGPPHSVRQFIAKLKAERVFACPVDSSGFAFHSKYIAAALPPLQTKLLELIPEPRPRSKRWLSTVLTPDERDVEWGQLCSAEYIVKNTLQPVRFADALRAIPERAIVVEVAPHALLNSILRRALPSATHVPLVRRDHPDPLAQLLQAVGRLFAAGAQPQVGPLYPPVAWPVSRGTPMLASAVEWDHSKECSVVHMKLANDTDKTIMKSDLGKPDQACLAGHNIDERVTSPAAGYLMQAKDRRPVWFVFGGLGCQWPRMGRALMQQPTFAASIARLSAALRPLDFDLTYLLTEAPESALDNIVNSATSISAVQVALVDVLREVGIQPDGIIGHSAGETGCAYADDTLTGEQVVVCMYWRTRYLVEASLPPGAMAAVGLSWAETERRCPPDVFPACHNAADNVTVAGPPESVSRFIAKLKAERVFTCPVDSSGLAFHSKYIEPVVARAQTKLEEVIPEPRPRSPRWISTSLTPDQENSEWGKLSSAKYFVNNMLSPVRFVDALRAVPERALVVEIAPHALLNSILRRVLPSATHVPLVRRDHPDPLVHLQEALDRLFAEGAQPHVSPLDPPVIRSEANSKLTNDGNKTMTKFDLGNPDKAFLSKANEPATSNKFADQSIKKNDQTIDSNLVPFINFGDLIPKQVIVKLPSLPPPSADTKPVFVIHPIEGVVDLFASVAACVRGAVYGLQCTRTAPLDSMPALASFYVQHVRATQPEPPYTLLGYSFGASVAVEMTLQLESEGCPVRLVLVEGSPAFVASHISRSKVNDSMRSAQADEAAALIYFAQTIKDSDAINGDALLRTAWPAPSELERLPHWDARATRVTGLIAESGLRFEKAVLNFAAHTFYRKLLLGATFKPTTKLAAPVMLFRARDSYVVLGEDYGLRAVCSGQLRTHELVGTHRTVLEGESGRIIADYVCSINV